MKKNLLKKTIAVFAVFCMTGLSSGPLWAADVALDVPIVSKYVWRGLEANTDLVLQPSLTVDTAYGLSFNLWGNMDVTGFGEEAGYGNRSGEFTELDLTGSYTYAISPVSLTGGIISYIFPGLGATTHELFLSAGADVIASPSLTWYSDVDEIKGSYFLLSVGHGFGLEAGPLTGVDVGLSAGYGSGSYNRGYFGLDKAAPVDLVVSLGLPMTFGPVSVTPSAFYSYLIDSEISDALGESGYFVASLTLGLTL